MIDHEAQAADMEEAAKHREITLKQVEEVEIDRKVIRGNAIFNWLSHVNIATVKDDSLDRCQEGTGRWLLESQEITDWIQGISKTIWLTGIPGAGELLLQYTLHQLTYERKKRTLRLSSESLREPRDIQSLRFNLFLL